MTEGRKKLIAFLAHIDQELAEAEEMMAEDFTPRELKEIAKMHEEFRRIQVETETKLRSQPEK